MSANRFGNHFCITSFGESHGVALGVVVDGCPAGINFEVEKIQNWLNRRRPGQRHTSARQELDQVEVLSGVYEGRTLGTPIAMIVRNHDARPDDYKAIASGQIVRPGHADDLWRDKFGHSDPRGGGRASGRETVARVMGGAVAQMLLSELAPELTVRGRLTRVGPLDLTAEDKGSALADLLSQAAETHESYGATVEVVCDGVPRGLGQPVFHKLKADLASAWMGVGATCAVEFGDGVQAAAKSGSDYHAAGQTYSGIRGGISAGGSIQARVTIKPTSSIGLIAKTGRHDPCVAIRALPVLEAMTWLVLADHALWARGDRLPLVAPHLKHLVD